LLNQRRTHLTVEERGKIIDLAAYALPVVDIARILKRSTSVVYQTLQDLDIPAKASERTDDHIATARQQATPLTPPEQAFSEAHPSVPRHPSPEMVAYDTDISRSSMKPGAYSTFLCADCGEAYSMTAEHLGWFYERGLNPPKRCEPCREDRRGTHDYDAGKDAANVAQAKMAEEFKADLEALSRCNSVAIDGLQEMEQIIRTMRSVLKLPEEQWASSSTVAEGHTDLDTIDLDHDLGVRDQRGPFGEEEG